MDLPVPGSDVKAHWLSDLRLSFLCQSETSGGRGIRDEDVKVTFSGTCCVYDAFWFRYFGLVGGKDVITPVPDSTPQLDLQLFQPMWL